jgi:high-affinity Fe2+/Pb2+ permease
MNIEMIETILMLFILVMFVYGLRLNDKRIKQIKSDYYTKGYTDGIDKMTNITLDMFKDNKIKSNEYEVL